MFCGAESEGANFVQRANDFTDLGGKTCNFFALSRLGCDRKLMLHM